VLAQHLPSIDTVSLACIENERGERRQATTNDGLPGMFTRVVHSRYCKSGLGGEVCLVAVGVVRSLAPACEPGCPVRFKE
jgi:hypothetical protein